MCRNRVKSIKNVRKVRGRSSVTCQSDARSEDSGRHLVVSRQRPIRDAEMCLAQRVKRERPRGCRVRLCSSARGRSRRDCPVEKMNMEGFPATGGGPRRARPTQWTAGTAQMEPSDPRRGRRLHDILRQREVADTEDPREGSSGARSPGTRSTRLGRFRGRVGNDGRHGLKPSTEPDARQAMLAPPYVLEPARRLLGGIDALSFIYQLPIVGLPDS
jgi:hypothetical protein